MKRLYDLTRRQHGLISRRQAQEHLTEGGLRHVLRKGTLVRMRPGSYAAAGVPPSWQQGVIAAVLSASVGAVASHGTAARLWGFAVGDAAPLEITVTRRQGPSTKGVKVHRAILPDNNRGRVMGVPVTSVERTIIDLAARVTLGQLGQMIDHARRHQLASPRQILDVLNRLGSKGRHGTARLRRLLAERLDIPQGSESHLEDRVLRWLHGSGFPLPCPQYEVIASGRRYRLDLAWPEQKVAMEVDGFAVHGLGRVAFDNDRVRSNALTLAGWLVLHVTSNTRYEELVTTLSQALHCRSPAA